MLQREVFLGESCPLLQGPYSVPTTGKSGKVPCPSPLAQREEASVDLLSLAEVAWSLRPPWTQPEGTLEPRTIWDSLARVGVTTVLGRISFPSNREQRGLNPGD